jgi:hypothetical protein
MQFVFFPEKIKNGAFKIKQISVDNGMVQGKRDR